MNHSHIIAAAAVLLFAGCGGPSLEHYWDDYDFSSQKGLEPIEAAQERFGKYIELLEKTDTATAAASIRDFLDWAAADTVSYFVYSDLFVSALYPLDSPYRNVELLRVYLRKAIADRIALDYLRFDEGEMLRKSYLNLPGSTAEDGLLIFADGGSGSVLEEAAKSSRTRLILVGQAGCRSCVEHMKDIARKTTGRIRLLAVVQDSWRGEAEWLREQLPDSWTVAVAGESFLNNYDFDLAPVSYILNRKGKVISLK